MRAAVALVAMGATACGPPVLRGIDAAGWRGFEQFLAEEDAVDSYREFVDYLEREGVADVVAPWHLWRQGTDWRDLEEPGFAQPDVAMWPAMVPTLVVLRDDVIPVTGAVRVVSGFRTERYNERAGGASGSRHKSFEAVDVVPLWPWTRSRLHTRLRTLFEDVGPDRRMGLGLYSGVRFHVDTHRFRTW